MTSARLFPLRLGFPLLAVGSLLTACSSSTGPNANGHYLRFDANGSQLNFTIESSLAAAFAHAGNEYNALMTGFDATSNLSLQVFDGAAITTKQYTGYQFTGGAFVGVLITYQPSAGLVYSSVATANSDAVITITELTATDVKGTFSGTLKKAGQPDIVATNGEFSLHRAN
jgi:hypothetical protein